MANKHLKFFDKQGNPLNFDYIGATAGAPLIYSFKYESWSTDKTPSAGKVSLYSISSNLLYFNINDINGYNITPWINAVNSAIEKGGHVSLKITFHPANVLTGIISSIVILGDIVTMVFSSVTGVTNISNGNSAYCEAVTEGLAGGYFRGSIFFDEVSAGLYENEQIFIIQEFEDSVTGDHFIGLPHTGATGSINTPLWRTRWENDNYGSTDVTNIIFTYKINENDPEIDGSPSITNYQNLTIPVILSSSDIYSTGYIITPETGTPSRSLSINVAINAPDIGAEVYERKLIIEDITSGISKKIAEILFYGQVIGEDKRLDVLTQNMGRAFFGSDSPILRDHDPAEPLPDYLEINEKRKELMVAGEEIFPYIGSYKGLIGALKFFGYQDLRIKEYWLNLKYAKADIRPVEENRIFLNKYKETKIPNQVSLISDILDNENSGKYRLEQTYGPNSDGEYVLDVSSQNTLVPSRTYKKTALFGLYYDINTESTDTDPYGYPVTPEAFAFTQEEVLVKLFALKERLKKSYLPLNARIVDITGEGVYFNVYNTKEWTDTLKRVDIESGNDLEFKANPDFGFLEDLRAFGIRESVNAIQAPMNYYNEETIEVSIAGPSGDVFRFSGVTGDNQTLNLSKGKRYNFVINSDTYNFILSTNSGLTGDNLPLGVTNSGATGGGIVAINVNSQEQTTIYYYSDVNTSTLNGAIKIVDSSISDLGNIVQPITNGQKYTPSENLSMLGAVSNFYHLKENGLLKFLGDNVNDPIIYINSDGLEYKLPVGMPIVLELEINNWTWDEMGMSWDSMELPDTSSSAKALTWDSIDLSAYNEIEWVIEKSQNQVGSGYYFSHRGYTKDFYKLAHFLPYTGEYDVTCYLYDAFNFRNIKIKKSSINVSAKEITIDAWTRYKENENYTWDQTVRDWDDYNSTWISPAEGKTYNELTKEIPKAILDFAIYGNNALNGQELLLSKYLEPIGASGDFVIDQDILSISKAYSLYVSGSQYGYINIFTTQPHSFIEGSQVFISDSIEDLNKSWNISIPSGATGYSFTIPYILSSQAGVGITSGASSIAGGTAYYLNLTFLPNQKVTGGGGITVSIDGRNIGSTASGSNIQATVNGIIQEINKITTYPDYFAQSFNPDASPATINIASDTGTGGIGNGDILTVSLTGSLSLISTSSILSGGITGGTAYVSWAPSDEIDGNSNIKYFGTKNLTWDMLSESTWDEAYAHSWDDFSYNNGWLGGYEIHSTKIGDHIKVSPGKETYPFPVGVTFTNGPSGYLTLGNVADQLNNSTDENVTNFYYRVRPVTSTTSLTTAEPVEISFNSFGGTGGISADPATMPGAPPPLVVNFTYATGP